MNLSVFKSEGIRKGLGYASERSTFTDKNR